MRRMHESTPANTNLIRSKEKIMKKAFAFILAASLTVGMATAVFAHSAFVGVQSASAYLDQDGKEIRVTVDLSDGWSAEFAHGAVYLYDGPNDGEKDAIAMGLTLEKEAFEDHIARAEEMTGFRTEDGIVSYVEEDGTQDYFFEVDNDSEAYFMISVLPDTDGDAIMSRFAAHAEDIEEDVEIVEEESVSAAESADIEVEEGDDLEVVEG